jgi:hypothetical protein
MKYSPAAVLLAWLWAASGPDASIAYFINVREVTVAQPDRQNYVILDEEVWNHSRANLADLRLYEGETRVPHVLIEQRGGISSEDRPVKILNLGSVAGRTELDLAVGEVAEYDRIRLMLEAKDFVAKVTVRGMNALGQKPGTELGSSTLYDFGREKLGANSVAQLPPSNFPYLHLKFSSGIRPEQIKGASVYNLQDKKAAWTNAGSCQLSAQTPRQTQLTCTTPVKMPLDRILFQVAPGQVNFRRPVAVTDSKGRQVATGDISRIRIHRGGTAVVSENLSVTIPGICSGRLTITVDNGDDPPLAFPNVQPLSIERRLYFDLKGSSSLKLYYGDDKLSAPTFDYAKFFREDPAAAQAQLGPGAHNPAYTGRPDVRPWSERHQIVLWVAMLLAVAVLALLALRGFRTGAQGKG